MAPRAVYPFANGDRQLAAAPAQRWGFETLRFFSASAALALTVAGCSPSAEEVSKGSYDPAKLAYFQDPRTGLCFAVSAYSRTDSNGRWAGGLSHAGVPCSEAVLKLVR